MSVGEKKGKMKNGLIKLENGLYEGVSPKVFRSYWLLSKEGKRYAKGCERLASILYVRNGIPTTVNGLGKAY